MSHQRDWTELDEQAEKEGKAIRRSFWIKCGKKMGRGLAAGSKNNRSVSNSRNRASVTSFRERREARIDDYRPAA